MGLLLHNIGREECIWSPRDLGASITKFDYKKAVIVTALDKCTELGPKVPEG